ncbi:MAG: MFS transporter [Candidatus Hermodarchaeota archaeon]
MKNKKENIIKKTWPAFISKASYAMTISAVYLNVIIISNLLWQDGSFHSSELGLMIGSSMIMTAISGLLFGYLADKFSRKKIYEISIISYGFGLVLNGFLPYGLGDLSFYLFFVVLLIQGFFSGAFAPTETSYVNDIVDESMRSRFYGSINAVFQLAQIIGMLVSSFLFQNLLLRQFYWIIGSFIIFEGFLVAFKAREPKRGMNQEELKDVLKSSDIKYNYQLTKETLRNTVLRRTNIVAFVEGIFTTVLLSIPDFLLIAYITGPPHNVAPFTTTIFLLMTGVPGAIIGSISFAKMSDNLAKKKIQHRIYMIITSLIGMFGIFLLIFFLPIPNFSVGAGQNILIIFNHPEFVIMGVLAFLAKMIHTIYFINQPPILQKINLPEAQGKISSANQFLELIGSGLGPIIAGFLLASFNQNYQITVLISASIGMISCLAWLIGAKSINNDIQRISSILKIRAEELKENGQILSEISLISHD